MSSRTADRKKKFERFLLEHFLRVAKIRADIVEDTEEAPDLIIRTDRNLIGVELTELFIDPGSDGNSQQAQEGIAQRIVMRAHEIYRQRGGAHEHVSVHFSSASDLRQLNREQTAECLASYVQSLSLSAWERREWRPDYVSKILPDAINCLNMLGVPEAEMTHWSPAQAGWIGPLTLDAIQERVDQKAARLPKYRDRIPVNWLLLVSDGARPSQFFEPPTAEVAEAVVSPFERTIYFARFKEVIVELGPPTR